MDKGITVLVIDADVSYAKTLADYLRRQEGFLEAQYRTDGDEGYKMMNIMRPDVLIVDFLVPGLSAVGILRQLKTDCPAEKPKVIVSSVTMTRSMVNAATETGADYFMVKPQPFDEICSTILDLVGDKPIVVETKQENEDEYGLDMTISRFLHYIGVPAHLSGYTYIRTSLIRAIDDLGSVLPITRKLYPELARQYNKSPECVERAIRHAIKVSWERGNKKIIHDIFGYSSETPYMGCPTNSEYIAMVADDLRIRIKHNIAI